MLAELDYGYIPMMYPTSPIYYIYYIMEPNKWEKNAIAAGAVSAEEAEKEEQN